jgi:DNA processing protein
MSTPMDTPMDTPMSARMDTGRLIALAGLSELRSGRLGQMLEGRELGEVWASLTQGGSVAYRTAKGAEREIAGDRISQWRAELLASDPLALAEAHRRCGVGVVARGDDRYPAGLELLPDPPGVIFWRGDLDLASREASSGVSGRRVAMVGTRRATSYGRQIARSIARTLADRGVHVVSGLAAGIDGSAHHGVVASGDELPAGRPIAVVGCGLDRVYPTVNRDLWQAVAKAGVIVTEHPLGSKPLPWHFPQRNRLIVALSDAVVVVESAVKGGSMITADAAITLNKTVFAVPGPITSPVSSGAHDLLAKTGVKLCGGAHDVLRFLGEDSTPLQLPFDARRPPDTAGAVVLQRLGWEVLSVESLLARMPGAVASELLLVLHELEFDGWVARGSAGWFQLAPVGARTAS